MHSRWAECDARQTARLHCHGRAGGRCHGVLRPDCVPRHCRGASWARPVRTSDHRVLMPGVLLLGALLGLLCDLITHLPWSRHFLHLNAVNGLIGAPLVLWALLDRKRGIRFE
jgi:hypothetical protein